MRRKPTKFEADFEEKLKVTGLEYKKQMVLGFYIMDFCLPTKMLCIEIDGAHHSEVKDCKRDDFIKLMGFQVIRIKNEEVTQYDLTGLNKYPEKSVREFRRGLSRANVERGRAIERMRKQGLWP